MEALLIAGTAVSALGAIRQGEAQQASYNAQAQAQEYNATVARNNAKVASDQANAKEEAQRRHFNALQGQAIAGVAQSGTGFEGSNADILKQNAINNELDALTIRYEGQNQANGLMAQSQLDTYGASASRTSGTNAMNAAYLNAGSSLLSGASKYNYYSRTGTVPGMS